MTLLTETERCIFVKCLPHLTKYLKCGYQFIHIKLLKYLSTYDFQCTNYTSNKLRQMSWEQDELQTIKWQCTYMPNISRSKDNQTVRLGQLIEYNMRNTFLEKSYTKGGGETIPRVFTKKPKLSISLDQ